MTSRALRFAFGLVVAVGWGLRGFAALAAEPSGKFVDVTAESGVAAVVEAHYRASPKWWLSGLSLVDLDGDGDLDLHLASHSYPVPAAAAANDGRGHFTYVDPKMAVPRGVRAEDDLPYPGGEIRLAFDFDEDGRLDVLASWHDGGGVLYRGDCRPGSPPAWNFRRTHVLDQFNRAAAMADVDRDGRVDYLSDAGPRNDPQILVLFGMPDGSFGRRRLVPGALEEACPIPVDLDGDGDLDFLISRRGYHPAGRRILRNDGNLRFTDVTRESGLAAEEGSIHGVGDLDSDGDLDLICVEGAKRPLEPAIYLNDGAGRFTRKPDAIEGAGKLRIASANWGGAVVTDLDNDGLPDILINGRYFLYVLRGTGGGRFAVANDAWGVPSVAWSAVDEGLSFGDLDGDGDLDLVACSDAPTGKQKSVSVLRNDVAAGHWLRVRPIGKPGNCSATGAKIRVYEAGGLGDPKRLLWFEQVAVWGRQSFHSYYAAPLTERHFGLGTRRTADVSVEFYPSGRTVAKRNVNADGRVDVEENDE